MKVFAVALLILSGMVVTMAACDLVKSTGGDITPEPEPEVLTSREKAIEVAKRIHSRRAEVVRKAIETEDFSTFSEDLDRIYREELGDVIGYEQITWRDNIYDFERSYAHTLFKIHYEENPNGEMRHDETPASDIDLIIAYLEFKFLYSDVDIPRDDLTILFTEVVHEGNTTTNPEIIAERYDFYSLIEVPAALAEKKSRESVERLFQRSVEIIKLVLEMDNPTTEDFVAADEESKRVFQEEAKFGQYYLGILLTTYNNISNERANEEDAHFFINVVGEYLRLSFKYPEERSYLLELFEQSVQNGRVTVDAEKLAEIYDFYYLFPGEFSK